MLCGHPDCTNNHHAYPNLCPATVERNRLRKHNDHYRELERERHHRAYDALSGFAYSHLLLKHRRAKALLRIEKRRH